MDMEQKHFRRRGEREEQHPAEEHLVSIVGIPWWCPPSDLCDAPLQQCPKDPNLTGRELRHTSGEKVGEQRVKVVQPVVVTLTVFTGGTKQGDRSAEDDDSQERLSNDDHQRQGSGVTQARRPECNLRQDERRHDPF